LGACSAGLDGIDAEYTQLRIIREFRKKKKNRNQDSSLDFKLQPLGVQHCDEGKKKKTQEEKSVGNFIFETLEASAL